MSTQQLNISQLRNHLKNFQLDKLFIEGLGWENPIEGKISGTITFKDNVIPYTRIATINNVPILKFSQETLEQFKKEFDKTFKIFNQYEWHLQSTRAETKGEDKDISPDIMGYIFEKYINELQQKSLGAYYTRDEITKYLSRNTIYNCILDRMNQKGYEFENIAELLHKLDAPLCKMLLTNKDSILNTLTILDPAVGSGAFLVSAMKELMNIYSPIIGKIETSGDRDLKEWFQNFKNEHKSVEYGIKKNIILRNLYAVDIMKEATEVCKLRLFLSLVSSALDVEELEPLPNMDFNIMCGNSLIGFLKEEQKIKKGEKQLEWDAVLGESYQKLKETYNKMVSRYKDKSLPFKQLKELKIKIEAFLNKNNSKFNRVLADKCNEKGLKYSEIKDIQGKKKSQHRRAVRPEDFSSKEDEKDLKPFHWDFAFNEIMNNGGFDIIITNPPWEKIKNEDKEFFAKYDPEILTSKRCKKSELNVKKNKLLQKSEIKKNYLKTEEFYLFQRDYFLELYQYQSKKIINRNGLERYTSSDMESYRLFTERYFNLLGIKGFLGVVLPRGFYCDEGAFGIRKHVLENLKIEGLITFVNGGKGKPIFEGVGSPVQFLFLNLKKDKPQDQFPCHFQEKDLQVLIDFPEENTMKQSVNTIKELQPRDYSIIEFKHSKDVEITKKAKVFSELREKMKDSWNPVFYSEFHETNDAYLFKNKKLSNNYLPLYVGKAIKSFQFNYDLSHVNRYIDKFSSKAQSKGLSFKNKFYENYRLVVRTIASTGDEKLITAVIPKNSFISNSLHGVHIEADSRLTKYKYMLLLQSFLNSFFLNYFIGQKIYFNVNIKYLDDLHIPRLTEKDPYFKELVERSAKLTCIGKEFDELADEIGIQRGGVTNQQERWKIQGEIDAIVAYVYDLTQDEFEYILSTFTTGKNQERLRTLKNYALDAFIKDRFLDKAS